MGINLMFHPASLVEDMPVVCQRLLLGAASVLNRPELSPRPSDRSRYRPSHNTTIKHDPERPSSAATTNSFTLFPNLPAEIRELIWSFAIDHPSERLFHVERLRPATSDPAVAKWRFYRRLRTDTRVYATGSSSDNKDNKGFPTSRRPPSLTASTVGASCSEARAVLLRGQPRCRARLDGAPASTDVSPSAAASPRPADSVTLSESFDPSRDILYFDSACLGRPATAFAARSRIKALSAPTLAAEVEVLGIDMHCVLSTSYPVPTATRTASQTCPDAEDVQSVMLQALCDGFPRLRRIILITSRQCLPRRRGFAEMVSSATASTATMRDNHEHDKRQISETLAATASWAFRAPLLTLAAGLDMLLLLSLGGHDEQQRNYPSDQGAGGSSGDYSGSNNKTPSAREIAEEHECCKTLAACLVSPSDLEIPLPRDRQVRSGRRAAGSEDEGNSSGWWVRDMDAHAHDVREVLARLAASAAAVAQGGMNAGGRKMVPVVETKVVVRAGGCTGPWTYRARIENGSCSNDEWFWGQKKGMELPVWKVRGEVLGKLDFS